MSVTKMIISSSLINQTIICSKVPQIIKFSSAPWPKGLYTVYPFSLVMNPKRCIMFQYNNCICIKFLFFYFIIQYMRKLTFRLFSIYWEYKNILRRMIQIEMIDVHTRISLVVCARVVLVVINSYTSFDIYSNLINTVQYYRLWFFQVRG